MNVDARSTLTAIVCAYNEEKSLPAALHSLFAQTRVPDEVIVVNNASTDRTRAVAERFPGVVVVDEPQKGLVRARAKGLSVARGDILLYIDADCRAPLRLVERMERQFLGAPGVVAVTGPYRFYDWDWIGVAGARVYDYTLAPFAQFTAHYLLRMGAVLYGATSGGRPCTTGRRTSCTKTSGSDMPGYDPYLLCDFHTHTTWSDGRLSIRELVDLYGETGCFDVIAITDHILRKNDVLAKAARVATFGRRRYSVLAQSFDEYLGEIAEEAQRPRKLYGMLVLPGAEIIKNHVRARKNAHIIALGIREYISADEDTETILKEIRRQGAISIACHPHHRTTRRIEISTCYLWDHRDDLVDLVDLWEAANRDDLFSVPSLKHFPYIANSDCHRPKHL